MPLNMDSQYTLNAQSRDFEVQRTTEDRLPLQSIGGGNNDLALDLITELAASLDQIGLQAPIHVQINADGDPAYRLLDGAHRLAAMRHNLEKALTAQRQAEGGGDQDALTEAQRNVSRFSRIPAFIHPAGKGEELHRLTMLDANLRRRHLTPDQKAALELDRNEAMQAARKAGYLQWVEVDDSASKPVGKSRDRPNTKGRPKGTVTPFTQLARDMGMVKADGAATDTLRSRFKAFAAENDDIPNQPSKLTQEQVDRFALFIRERAEKDNGDKEAAQEAHKKAQEVKDAADEKARIFESNVAELVAEIGPKLSAYAAAEVAEALSRCLTDHAPDWRVVKGG